MGHHPASFDPNSLDITVAGPAVLVLAPRHFRFGAVLVGQVTALQLLARLDGLNQEDVQLYSMN